MTATNHGLTGVVIGMSINQPVAALFLALSSHFLLDALPHFGTKSHSSKRFLLLLAADLLGILLIFSGLVIFKPNSWELALGCAFLAMIPDVMWLPNWLYEISGKAKRKHKNFIIVFHKKIQTAERVENWPIEVIWFALCISLVAKFTVF